MFKVNNKDTRTTSLILDPQQGKWRRVDQGNRVKNAYRRIQNDMAWEERMRTIGRNSESELEEKLLTPSQPG